MSYSEEKRSRIPAKLRSLSRFLRRQDKEWWVDTYTRSGFILVHQAAALIQAHAYKGWEMIYEYEELRFARKKEKYRGEVSHRPHTREVIEVVCLEAITHGDDMQATNIQDVRKLKMAIARHIERVKLEFMDFQSEYFDNVTTRIHPHHFSLVTQVGTCLEAAQIIFENEEHI